MKQIKDAAGPVPFDKLLMLWRNRGFRRLKSLSARLAGGLAFANGRSRIIAHDVKDQPMAEPVRSNLEIWKKLQGEGYFENHPCYKGITDFSGHEAVQAIQWFVPIRDDMRVAVIGCGYGRETLRLAPLVNHVYGIDVSETILKKAVSYLSERHVKNFTPVLAEKFAQTIPAGIDLVFSIVVMQHLTRDLVRNYFVELARKLAPGGGFVVQFLNVETEDYRASDAPVEGGGEPSVHWSPWQLVELSRLAGLKFVEIRTQLVTDVALWHWVYFRKEVG
jgi:SAM-dependent methyltransferase